MLLQDKDIDLHGEQKHSDSQVLYTLRDSWLRLQCICAMITDAINGERLHGTTHSCAHLHMSLLE